jgi:hypothetical protein
MAGIVKQEQGYSAHVLIRKAKSVILSLLTKLIGYTINFGGPSIGCTALFV